MPFSGETFPNTKKPESSAEYLPGNLFLDLGEKGPEFIIDNLDSYEESHKEIAVFLIDREQGKVFVEHLEKFEGLDHPDIADHLVNTWQGEVLADNLEKFKGLDYTHMAHRFVDTEQGTALMDNFEKFKGLNHTHIACRLINTEQGGVVADNLGKFRGLTDEVYFWLVEHGYGHQVTENPGSFQEAA